MLTLMSGDNVEIAAVSKARSVGSPKSVGLTLGTVLIYCLLFSSLVGKSHLFFMTGYVWQVQMAVVTATVIIGLLFSVGKRFQRGTCHQSSELPLQVKACLATLLCVCIMSCMVQERPLHNLVFLLVFAGMVYLLCMSGADFVGGISGERRIDFALAPLNFMAVGSMTLIMSGSCWASYQAISSGRFKGIYSDSIIAGQMFGLTSLLLFWGILHMRSKKVWGRWALLPIALICLVLTRTRTGILGTLIGMITCLSVAIWSSTAVISRRRARALFGLLVLLLVISPIWVTRAVTDIGRTREYLRIPGDLEDTLRARSEYWKTGTGNLSLKNIFGNGPLAKFGGGLSTQESGYVRELNMHNAFLSVFQFYGWPGGVLFIIFLALVGVTFLKRRDPYATLGLSLLAFGLVQSIAENWLLSFGTPLDTYSWFILGVTLTQGPSNSRFEIADNSCRSY